MRDDALAANSTGATTIAVDTSRNIRRSCIAAVVEFLVRLGSGSRCHPLGFVSGQKPGNHISRFVIARPVTQRSDPVFTLPCDDDAVAVHAGALLDNPGGTE